MMAKKTSHKGSYVTGYGKPPKEHQFKPGESGNPKGRPKGPGNILKSVARHARRKVTVIENGVEKKMTSFDVLVSAMFNKGMQRRRQCRQTGDGPHLFGKRA